MSNLTALTCSNCGGRLTSSHTASLLVCLYCGVEHYASELPEAEDSRPQLHGAISLGLPDGMAVQLIPRGTRLPVEILQSFSTTTDNQTRLDITLVFGENHLTRDNVLLGTFVIDNIRPAPRGVSTLELRMNIDDDKQLTVTATEVSARRTEILGSVDLSDLMPPPL